MNERHLAAIGSFVRRIVNKGEVERASVVQTGITTTVFEYKRVHYPFSDIDEMIPIPKESPAIEVLMPNGQLKVLIISNNEASPSIGATIEIGKRFPLWSVVSSEVTNG